VNTSTFTPADKAAARGDLGLVAPRIVVCVGRLSRQKGQDRLLDAWPRVRKELPDAELMLVGDGPIRCELEKRATPGVRFAGESADTERWYAAADVVVVPSRWEGMALVPLEAMACGRPVVGFGVQGVQESVGEAGAVVPPGDVGALGEELVARLRSPQLADDEGRLGRARVLERFTLRDSVAAITSATRELVR
jgi:glycosyltransferase involved in cell wall biosynthesis